MASDTSSVWDGVTINFDNLVGGGGYDWYNEFLVVGGSDYRLLHAYMVAGLREMGAQLVAASTAAAAAGSALPIIKYGWDTGTADANPGSGLLRANNATLSSATTLFLSTSDTNAVDVSAIIGLYDDSTSTTKGYLAVGHRTDPTKWVVYAVSGSVVTATGYRKVTVSYVAGPGGFSAADHVALGFVQTGWKGDTGATGAAGANGTNGAGPVWHGTSGGSANAQTLSGGLASLTGNPSVEWIAGYTSTSTTVNLTVGSTAQTRVKDAAGADPVVGAIVAGSKYVTTYDGTYWRLAGGGFLNPMTGPGDLIGGGGAGVATRIAHPGVAGLTLKTTSATAFGWVYDLSNTVWSATDKNAAVTISNAGRTALVTGGVSGRATTGVSSGRWYWEVELNAQSLSNSFLCGVAALTAAQNDYLGVAALTWAYDGLGRKVTGGTYTAYGSSVTTSIRIGFALDMDSGGLMWVRVSGTWQGSGDPATGANPMFSGISGTVAPAVSNNNGGSSTATTTGYFSASTWTDSAPANFRALP
jgi:hypothetical protein